MIIKKTENTAKKELHNSLIKKLLEARGDTFTFTEEAGYAITTEGNNHKPFNPFENDVDATALMAEEQIDVRWHGKSCFASKGNMHLNVSYDWKEAIVCVYLDIKLQEQELTSPLH